MNWHFEPSNIPSSSESLGVVPAGESPDKETRQLRRTVVEAANLHDETNFDRVTSIKWPIGCGASQYRLYQEQSPPGRSH